MTLKGQLRTVKYFPEETGGADSGDINTCYDQAQESPSIMLNQSSFTHHYPEDNPEYSKWSFPFYVM